MSIFGIRQEGELIIDIDIKLRYSSRYLVLKLSGSAANDNADFLNKAFSDIETHFHQDSISMFLVDLVELSFCYSNCVKVLMNALTESVARPETELIIGKAMWQVTSVRAMGTMISSCKVVNKETSSIWQHLTNQELSKPHGSCEHANTESVDDNFFAPTGNGSIRTTIKCADCGFALSQTSEYFN